MRTVIESANADHTGAAAIRIRDPAPGLGFRSGNPSPGVGAKKTASTAGRRGVLDVQRRSRGVASRAYGRGRSRAVHRGRSGPAPAVSHASRVILIPDAH